MARLFRVVRGSVVPTDEVLQIPVFRELWERDGSKRKEEALFEYAYIEFMCSQYESNPYRGYSDVDRGRVILEDFGRVGWEPDGKVRECMERYVRFMEEGSVSYRYYIGAWKAAEKVREFLETVDLTEKTERGMPVYKPSEVTSALLNTDRVLANLRSLERRMFDEFGDVAKVRAGKVVSPFAEGSDVRK